MCRQFRRIGATVRMGGQAHERSADQFDAVALTFSGLTYGSRLSGGHGHARYRCRRTRSTLEPSVPGSDREHDLNGATTPALMWPTSYDRHDMYDKDPTRHAGLAKSKCTCSTA